MFSLFLLAGCSDSGQTPETISSVPAGVGGENLEAIAHDAFIYAYPMMEQVKAVNGMFDFLGMQPNQASMNPKLPWENVGQPIVAPNLTSMTGGIYIDISHGPVTIEIPEVKDRYIVYQCIDVFTHNFYYMGTRGNSGEGGRFVFHKASQVISDSSATPVEMEGDHAIIVIRIDIKNEDEYDRVRAIQEAIRIVDAPEQTRIYPAYDEEKAVSPEFVEYVNELLTEIPESEVALFERFARIGVMSDVDLSDAEMADVQAGIDSALREIETEKSKLIVGNGYIGATEVFGTRDYLDGNYLGRASGAKFGLWGTSKPSFDWNHPAPGRADSSGETANSHP